MELPALANAELTVMELLWNEGSLNARQIREWLYPNEKKPQHGTVQRLLQRLEDKGYVERDASRHVQHFSALVTREEYAGSQLELLAERLSGGSLAPLITHLVEHRRISAEELIRLRLILDDQAASGGKE